MEPTLWIISLVFALPCITVFMVGVAKEPARRAREKRDAQWRAELLAHRAEVKEHLQVIGSHRAPSERRRAA